MGGHSPGTVWDGKTEMLGTGKWCLGQGTWLSIHGGAQSGNHPRWKEGGACGWEAVPGAGDAAEYSWAGAQ